MKRNIEKGQIIGLSVVGERIIRTESGQIYVLRVRKDKYKGNELTQVGDCGYLKHYTTKLYGLLIFEK